MCGRATDGRSRSCHEVPTGNHVPEVPGGPPSVTDMTNRLARTATAGLLITLATIGLAACSGSATESGAASGSAPATAAGSGGDALADLKASGVLRVGTEGTYAPFSFHDTSTGDLTGYDVEVVTAVADKLGVKPEFSEVKWDAIFAGLEAKRFDLVANEVTVNEERTAKYDLSDPNSVSVPVAIVRSDDSAVRTLADVTGKKAAQTATSNWGQLATDSGAEVVPVDGFTESVAALKDNRVDLTFNDNLAFLSYEAETSDSSVKVAFELPDRAVSQAFALRKDSGLLKAVNGALDELRADGTLAALGEKYFGSDISTPKGK